MEGFIFIGNFSEDRQFVSTQPFQEKGILGNKTDLSQGKAVDFSRDYIQGGPFKYLWLAGRTLNR